MLCKLNLGSISTDVLYSSLTYLFPVNGGTILIQENYITFSFKAKIAQHSIICVYCKLKVDEKFKRCLSC